jgi:hypothetical protein
MTKSSRATVFGVCGAFSLIVLTLLAGPALAATSAGSNEVDAASKHSVRAKEGRIKREIRVQEAISRRREQYEKEAALASSRSGAPSPDRRHVAEKDTAAAALTRRNSAIVVRLVGENTVVAGSFTLNAARTVTDEVTLRIEECSLGSPCNTAGRV